MTIAFEDIQCETFSSSYKAWQSRVYVPVMCLPAVLYACSCVLIAFVTRNHTATVYLCLPPTAMYGMAGVYWLLSNLSICFLIIIVYGAALIVARMSGEGFALLVSTSLLSQALAMEVRSRRTPSERCCSRWFASCLSTRVLGS